MNMKVKLIMPVIFLSGIIAAILIATFIVSRMQSYDGLVINLAGRQRMLSQKMVKEILVFEMDREKTGNDDKNLKAIIKNTMRVFDTTLSALTVSGMAPLALDPKSKTSFCPEAKEPAYSQLKKVGGLWNTFKAEMNSIMENKETAEEKLKWVLANNIPLLTEMNKAVVMMQKQSESKVNLLLSIQLVSFFVSIICIIFSVLMIFKIIRMLRESISDLSSAAMEVAQGSGTIANSSQSLADLPTRRHPLRNLPHP